MADPTRWRILEMLSSRELSSGEIAGAFELRWPTISKHLAVLEEAGLVRKVIAGRRRLYATDREGFARVASSLRRILPPGLTVGVAHGDQPVPPPPAAPLAVDVFVGRHRELLELTSLLGDTRMLTVAGAPGVGKTRLARELAARVADLYNDGLQWVELARVTESADVVRAITNVIDMPERAGQSRLVTLLAYLRAKHALLVLDNCEHVREGCAQVIEAISSACPLVTVLATSQTELAIPGETVWRLPPLGLDAVESAGKAGDSEAVQLFKERARLVRPDFALDVAGLHAVGQLCRRLDGIPLAIELAAARVGVLTPLEIADRVSDRFALLESPREADVERHQTLRGAIAWSYGLLPPAQQQLLSRMSVFVGGADLYAIENVCPSAADRVLPDVTHLVAASLVSGDTRGSHARYQLLETVRAYGAEQVASAGETAALRTRHMRWFLSLAERAEPELTGADEQSWLNQLEADDDNLRAAIAWAGESGDHETALRITSAMVLYWRVRNRFSEGRRSLDAALVHSAGHPPALRMRALWGAGFMALMLNDLNAAIAHLDESLALAVETNSTRGSARALLLLGNAWLLKESSATPAPDPGVAGMLSESAAKARRAGDAWCLAHALSLLGWLHMRSGDTAAARKPLEDALAVAREASDRQGLRLSLTMLGRLAQRTGETRVAEEFLSEAVYISEELGDGFGVGAALTTLSETALVRGDYDRAETLLERAAALLKEADASASFRAIYGLGAVALDRGDLESARRRFNDAAGIADETNTALAHIGLGNVSLADGDLSAAQANFELASSGQGGQTDADALAGLAAVARAQGDLMRAASLQHDALAIRKRIRDTPGIIESLERLACIASEGGRHDHAARLFGAVTALSSEAGLARPYARQREMDAAIAATQHGLGRNAFRAAFTAGKALTLDQAIGYATRGRGARRRPRTGWGSITQMERAVVAQAIQGLSNAEIAKQLFISPHTAAWHLSQVYGKLGVSSRTQLAHAVATRREGSRNNP